jgi:hypothetical protein
MLLLAPLEVAARSAGAGFGARSFHSFGARSFHSRTHFRASRRFPLYGGVGVSTPYYDYDYAPDDIGSNQLGGIVSTRPEPPRALCQHSEETVTVKSEDGGTREIRIIRC